MKLEYLIQDQSLPSRLRTFFSKEQPGLKKLDRSVYGRVGYPCHLQREPYSFSFSNRPSLSVALVQSLIKDVS